MLKILEKVAIKEKPILYIQGLLPNGKKQYFAIEITILDYDKFLREYTIRKACSEGIKDMAPTFGLG